MHLISKSTALTTLFYIVIAAAKTTYKLEEKPLLKTPSTGAYQSNNCAYNDGVNYICL